LAATRLHSPLRGLEIASATVTALDLQLRHDFEYGLLPLMGEVAIDNKIFPADDGFR
jgi:hypothetical protein